MQINKEVGQEIMVASGKDAELFYVATVVAVADDRVTVRNGAEFKVRSYALLSLQHLFLFFSLGGCSLVCLGMPPTMNIVLIRRCNTDHSLPDISLYETLSFFNPNSTMSKVWSESIILECISR